MTSTISVIVPGWRIKLRFWKGKHMLKEYLTMELERSQSRKLEAVLKEADMLPMAQEQKLELVQSLNGILVGK